MKINSLNTLNIEIAVANFFHPRINIIVPNVSWGMGLNYECDLLIVRPSYWAMEVEIKTTEQDIKADFKKASSAHKSKLIQKFSYAVPENLKASRYLPLDCGLISVNSNLRCKTIRPPRINKLARKLREDEVCKLLHLGCMRIWSLKQKIINQKRRILCKSG